MSTRANVVIKETYKDSFNVKQTNFLVFYRHSDGYPDVTLPTLNIFCKWLNSGYIRNNLSQAAGWLVILGAMEYNTIPEFEFENNEPPYKKYGKPETFKHPADWKVGAYEPTTCIHGDINYLYEIELTTGALNYYACGTSQFTRLVNKYNKLKEHVPA